MGHDVSTVPERTFCSSSRGSLARASSLYAPAQVRMRKELLVLLCIIVFGAFFLSPSLETGYLGDDAFNSMLPAMQELNKTNFFTQALQQFRNTFPMFGRAIFLNFLLFNSVFTAFPTLQSYKIYLLVTNC